MSMSHSVTGGSGSQAVAQGTMEDRLRTLEEHTGLTPSSGPKRQSHSLRLSRTPAAEHAPASRSQPLTQSASLPQIREVKPLEMTRQVQYRRTPAGGFMKDAPSWEVTAGSAPVLPSRHRMLSKSIWKSLNPAYDVYPEESDYKAQLIDHQTKGPPLQAFMNPRDKFVKYREELYKFGNQQIMRKGGSTMAKKA